MKRETVDVPASGRGKRGGLALKLVVLVLVALTVCVPLGCTGPSAAENGSEGPAGTITQALTPNFTTTNAPAALSTGTAYWSRTFHSGDYVCESTSFAVVVNCAENFYRKYVYWGPHLAVAFTSSQAGTTCPGTTGTGLNLCVSVTTTNDGMLYTQFGIPFSSGTWSGSTCQSGYNSGGFTPQFYPPYTCSSATSAFVPTEPGAFTPQDTGACPREHGMCAPRANKAQASLNLNDIPVGYQPQKGPDVHVRFSYNHLDTLQGMRPVGPNWTHTFMSYIEDSPSDPGEGVTRYAMGGGIVDYGIEATSGFDGATGLWGGEIQGGAVLKRIRVRLSWNGGFFVILPSSGHAA